jgi:hypothetical protein
MSKLDERIESVLEAYFQARHIKQGDERKLATGVLDMVKASEAVKQLVRDVLREVKPERLGMLRDMNRPNDPDQVIQYWHKEGFNSAIDELEINIHEVINR